MSLLKWIWGLLKKFFSFLHRAVGLLVDMASSVLAWIIAGLAWIVHLVFQYVGDFFEGLFENLSEIALDGIPVAPLASWIARDIVALDVAWECFMIYFAAWVAARIARSSFAAVRLLLDVA